MDEFHGEYEVLSKEYVNNSTKLELLHKPDGGVPHKVMISFDKLMSKKRCSVCVGQQVCIGYNDIATTAPDTAKLFVNADDAHKFTKCSTFETDFQCPNCGSIVRKKISYVTRNNYLSCPFCSDGISYQNKFLYNCLTQFDNIDVLYREYRPDWCKFDFNGEQRYGIYDFYIEVDDQQIIVELDGGVGHGKKFLGGLTPEQSLNIDHMKDKIAFEHGIDVIRIDCDYGENNNRYSFIKNQLVCSKLSNILDFKKINFDEANKKSLQSFISASCELWNNGYSVSDIVQLLGISRGAVLEYLKNGSNVGLCTYTKEESRNRSIGKKVICLNNLKIFDSIADASKYYNISSSKWIIQCCKGNGSTSGKDPVTKEKLKWMYYDDYLKSTGE